MNDKSGHNAFRRAIKEARSGQHITDAIKPSNLHIIDEPQKTRIITAEDGRQYIELLPNRRQEFSDKKQLKKYPQFRLITTTTTAPPMATPPPPDVTLIGDNLNCDVTEFLTIINDIGSRICYFLDPENANNFVQTRGFLPCNNLTLDTVTSNIIKGVEELKHFFFKFGIKIAPKGVNPYLNNECPKINKKCPKKPCKCDDGCKCVDVCRCKGKCGCKNLCKCKNTCKCNDDDYSNFVVNNNCFPDNGIQYPSAPYNPHDINTMINCLDHIAHQSIVRETDEDFNLFNLKVFQTALHMVKVTKFDDNDVIDENNVIRPQPFFNVLPMMTDILKCDCLLFDILYSLNMHKSFRSPITGAYYGKTRTKIGPSGIPVVNTDVTNTDVHSAIVRTIELMKCILKFISFLSEKAIAKIVVDHFSIVAIENDVKSADDLPIVIDDATNINNSTTTTNTNIPCFMFGHLLSYSDAARQVVKTIPIAIIPQEPLYDPTKVANIATNTTIGMLAVGQLFECLLKSKCFTSIMSAIFSSGQLYDKVARNPQFYYPRINNVDFISATVFTIHGRVIVDEIVPLSTLPIYGSIKKEGLCISICKSEFCLILALICLFSRFFWKSGVPYLNICDADALNALLPGSDNEWVLSGNFPPGTTTEPPGSPAPSEPGDPCECDDNPPIESEFDDQQYVKFLKEFVHKGAVLTCNEKIITDLQCYLVAYKNDIRDIFNRRASFHDECSNQPHVNKYLYRMLTRNMDF